MGKQKIDTTYLYLNKNLEKTVKKQTTDDDNYYIAKKYMIRITQLLMTNKILTNEKIII